MNNGQHFIGTGDFDQDGNLDLAGRDANQNFIIWRGTASGFGAPITRLATQGNWIPRSAAVNPDGTTVLISEDFASPDYRHQVLSSAGAITADVTAARPGSGAPMSLADFNNDGWPDLVFHLTGQQSFTVKFAAANATTTGNRTFNLTNGGGFSIITLPQSYRD